MGNVFWHIHRGKARSGHLNSVLLLHALGGRDRQGSVDPLPQGQRSGLLLIGIVRTGGKCLIAHLHRDRAIVGISLGGGEHHVERGLLANRK